MTTYEIEKRPLQLMATRLRQLSSRSLSVAGLVEPLHVIHP